MNAATELEVMKEAARRLEAFFAERGMNVKHGVALEALSASLGARNWRTVRNKLSQPDAPAALSTELLLAEGLEPENRFLVRGTLASSGAAYTRMFNVYTRGLLRTPQWLMPGSKTMLGWKCLRFLIERTEQ